MNLKKLLKTGITLGPFLFGLGLASCSNTSWIAIEGEDIIPTTGIQTITTPDRPGAWIADRVQKEMFQRCNK